MDWETNPAVLYLAALIVHWWQRRVDRARVADMLEQERYDRIFEEMIYGA